MTEQRCLELFIGAVDSPESKKFYIYQLNRFMKWMGVVQPEELLEAPPKDIQIKMKK